MEWQEPHGRFKKAKSLIKKLDAGRWRIEVSPAIPKKFDNFMHLIHIGDTKTAKMPTAEKIESKNHRMLGVAVGGTLVMFGRSGMVDDEVSYSVPKGIINHLIVDLKPGTRYLVAGTAQGENKITASEEGTLRFAVNGPATIKLTPEG